MDSVVIDFSDKFRPHGEGGVSYEYLSGELLIKVFDDDSEEAIRLHFFSCSYLYFTPWPGYSPFIRSGSELSVKDIPTAGCVYEKFGTQLLTESENVSEKHGYKPNRRHFWIYFNSMNLSFDVVAKDIKYSYL